ncbi:MAG: GtrA family protein, partial [Pseudomonadales bacterium]|nr:GtrA family protein [Pseudomonadales bacterium]
MNTQMLRFGMSGVAGYIVDSLVLYALLALGMGFMRGRLLSFVCAVAVTFLLNRRYTFAEQINNSPGLRPPLWLEFGRYFAAMGFGGLLNLATYWLVLLVIPPFPALFALAVAAGSLTGMVVNFVSAKWWVFMQRPEHGESAARGLASGAFALPRVKLTAISCLILVQAIFWTSHLTAMALPGLYMDAANPDYLAAHVLNSELPNPIWALPTPGPIILGSLYHGVQNFYVGLPVFALLGFNMLALRLAQGLFASGILIMTQLVLQRASGSLLLAFTGSLGLATELAFIASFRTQMYIVMSGTFWLLCAIYLALPRTRVANVAVANNDLLAPARMTWFFSGLCAGLAVYSYFVFLFFVPVFVALGWLHTRNWRSILIWLLGFALGMQTYVLGYALAFIALGGFEPTLEWLRTTAEGLGVMSSELTLTQRLTNAWSLQELTLQNIGNELMIFTSAGWVPPTLWTIWKVRLLVIAPLLLAVLGIANARKQRDEAKVETQAHGLLASWHLALLPITFIFVSLIFGSRLWSHHFSPLIPLAYVILFLAVYKLQIVTRRSLPKWAGMALMMVVIVGNIHQQRGFFAHLEASGGAGFFSNAINRMAEDALAMPAELVHVFPEWGFGMPFSLLTGNR